MNSSSFLPPDYSGAQENEFPQTSPPILEEDDDDLVEEDDLGIDDEDLEELDSASVNDKEDFEINPVQQQKQVNERIIMSTPQSSPPFSSVGGFGSSTPPSSPWQTQPTGTSLWGSQGSSFQRPQNQSPWGSQPSASPWGSSTSIGGQKIQINRSKKIIFCDFIDGAVEAYGANGKPGLRPRDIYDLHPRFEVWDKLAAFNPERIFFTIPASLIPSEIYFMKSINSFFCV